MSETSHTVTSTEDKVKDWLERGGYVLEMKVAQALLRRTNIVQQAERYTDLESGKEREIDVTCHLAFKSAASELHGLNLIVECKNTTAPWVCFVGNGLDSEFWVPASATNPENCSVCEIFEERVFDVSKDLSAVYAITEKHNDNDKTKAKDHAYEGVRQVSSAAVSIYKDTSPEINAARHGSRQVSILCIPIVVTSSPIYACSLDDSGEVCVQRENCVSMTVGRGDMPEDDYDGVRVLIMNFTFLEEFLDNLDFMVKEISNGSAVSRYRKIV